MIGAAVIDTSVVLKWVVDEPLSAAARGLSRADLVAPAMLRVECCNALWRKVRMNELSAAQAKVRARKIEDSPIEIISDELLTPMAFELCLELNHPIYDCLYLALALDRKLPVITDDRRLVALGARRADLRNMIVSLGTLAH